MEFDIWIGLFKLKVNTRETQVTKWDKISTQEEKGGWGVGVIVSCSLLFCYFAIFLTIGLQYKVEHISFNVCVLKH